MSSPLSQNSPVKQVLHSYMGRLKLVEMANTNRHPHSYFLHTSGICWEESWEAKAPHRFHTGLNLQDTP